MEAFRKAMAAHQAGRLVDAEKLYRRVLSFDANQFPPLVMLGTLYAQQGIFPQAERLFSEALQINPDDADVQFNYGNVLVALRRFDGLRQSVGNQAVIDPSASQSRQYPDDSEAVRGSDRMF